MDEKRALLRHTVATVAYRGGKAVRDAPPGFAEFSGEICRGLFFMVREFRIVVQLFVGFGERGQLGRNSRRQT